VEGHTKYYLCACYDKIENIFLNANNDCSESDFRKLFRSANGLAVLANSSLATTVGPGMEISLVTFRDLLAKRSEDHQ